MKTSSTVTQTTAKTQALTALQVLQRKNWEILNGCHGCGRVVGIHRKMDKTTFQETAYAVNLFNCHHGLKICNFCLDQGTDIRKPKFSKSQKKAFKKERVRELKSQQNERPTEQMETSVL